MRLCFFNGTKVSEVIIRSEYKFCKLTGRQQHTCHAGFCHGEGLENLELFVKGECEFVALSLVDFDDYLRSSILV